MLYYIIGDVTNPSLGDKPAMIAHVVNDMGGWGKGVSGDIGNEYPFAKREYRKWANRRDSDRAFELGNTQVVQISMNLYIANMLCQRGYKGRGNPMPFVPEEFYECFKIVVAHTVNTKGSIHMPRVGCGLGGATWETDVLPHIEKVLDEYVLPPNVYVYDLEEK